jgi:hypothetical protein
MADDPSVAARRLLAAQLARELEQRLDAVETFGGSCPCRNAEARAFLARLRQLVGEPQAVAAAPTRARYTRK